MIRTLALALLVGGPVLATPAADAFAAGRFPDAVALGRAGATAEDRIAAARAASVIATYETRDRAEARRLLEAAVADADAAVRLAPGSSRALLERAIVTGYLGKLKGSAGNARASRRDVETVLAREPDNALAHAVLGGWHGETVATVGPLVARTAVGARKEESLRHFERALALDGASVLYPVFYAFTLLALDPRANAQKAEALLARADRNRPADAYERLVQANGRQVLAALRAQDVARAATLARRLSPLGQIAAG
ncbi:hypothetical protein [Thermaurantiacus tibetensis]|uniref:hypothetical protein n=1 Tax=Thermaurantiacus tibetensis TaxID=2759035 RepID=UPI00188F8257|nr:hypothetical protein [Thermaurantiacus tibetensis]